jgi:hypothetical protein
MKNVSLALAALATVSVLSSAARADCVVGTYVNPAAPKDPANTNRGICLGKVSSLRVDNVDKTAYIDLSGSEVTGQPAGVGCVEGGLTLPLATPGFDTSVALLTSALLSGRTATVILAPGTTTCTVSAVFLNPN